VNSTDDLTPNNMKNMPYLRACIKEGLRLHPPTGGTVRKAGKDLVLSGHRIPEGTEVVMPIALFQRDCYSRNDEFIPERWLKHENTNECPHAKTEASPFSYLPFGFGSRVCIGKRLANLEIEVLLTRLIRDYKIEWNYPDLKFKVAILNIPDGDLKFKFTKVN
jgi:cytochrome P450 family 12